VQNRIPNRDGVDKSGRNACNSGYYAGSLPCTEDPERPADPEEVIKYADVGVIEHVVYPPVPGEIGQRTAKGIKFNLTVSLVNASKGFPRPVRPCTSMGCSSGATASGIAQIKIRAPCTCENAITDECQCEKDGPLGEFNTNVTEVLLRFEFVNEQGELDFLDPSNLCVHSSRSG